VTDSARARAAAALVGLLVPALMVPRPAAARSPSEEARVTEIVEGTLRKHGADAHRCFEKALADRMDVSGKVEIEVGVASGGAVDSSEVVSKSKDASPALAACLSTTVMDWKLPGIDEGTRVVLPFAFQGQAAQFQVKAADAPDRGPAAPAKGRGGAAGVAPFSVKLLVDEATMRARQASMSLLTIAPANRIAMHKHPGAEILYVVKGSVRILGPAGTPPQKLSEGFAAFVAPDMPHVLENMGRQTPAVLLQVFAPPGPERVYRDPQDAVGRAAFDVIRDAKAAKTPPGPPAPLTVIDGSKMVALPIAGGKAKVRILLEQPGTGSAAASLGILEAEPGAEVPRHSHAGAAEIVYVLAGAGELTVGSETVPFGPQQALHVPEGQPHAAKFTGPDKTIAVQVYAPAGPEQRFKQPRAAVTAPSTSTSPSTSNKP